MNCDTCKELLWFYLEETVTPEEKTAMADHIAHCEECKRELEEIKKMKQMLETLPDVDLPDTFHTTLMEKLQKETSEEVKQEIKQETKIISLAERKKDKFKWKNMGLVAAAMALVVVGGTTGMWHGAGSPMDAEAPMAEARMMEAPMEESVLESASEMESAPMEDSMDVDMGVAATGAESLAYQEDWQIVVADLNEFFVDIEGIVAEVDGAIMLVDIDGVEVSVAVDQKEELLHLLEKEYPVTISVLESPKSDELFVHIGCIEE